ncbi:membrane integrity-associated transporter subunit PqiC [candidate division KSB1 bacterium]|nr:membrane integrity-associated transporter subunit PqiC [candidate division KSB1 bacterium]
MDIKYLIIVLFSFLIISCGKPPDIHYYILDVSSKTESKLNSKFDGVIAIAPVTADEAYIDDRLIYRDSPYQIKFYHYHRWVTSPVTLIESKLYTKIKKSGLATSVLRQPYSIAPDLLLSTHLIAFQEKDENEKWYGEIILMFSLVDLKNNITVWQQEFANRVPASERKPEAVVEAINLAFDKCLDELIVALDAQLAAMN